MNVTSAQCSGMMSTRRIVTRAAKLLSRSYGQNGVKVSFGNTCTSQMPRNQVLPVTQSRGKAPLSLTRTWASAAESVALDEQTGVSHANKDCFTFSMYVACLRQENIVTEAPCWISSACIDVMHPQVLLSPLHLGL